jgi:hypothetical protein
MDVTNRPMLRGVAVLAIALSLTTGITVAQDCAPGGTCAPYLESFYASTAQNWWDSPHMSGDLFGARSSLAEHGIIADLYLTQFYQGVTQGGADERFRYGGKADYNFTFLGEPLGINKGFTAIIHAETRYGQDSILDAAGLAPVNANMLYPYPKGM